MFAIPVRVPWLRSTPPAVWRGKWTSCFSLRFSLILSFYSWKPLLLWWSMLLWTYSWNLLLLLLLSKQPSVRVCRVTVELKLLLIVYMAWKPLLLLLSFLLLLYSLKPFSDPLFDGGEKRICNIVDRNWVSPRSNCFSKWVSHLVQWSGSRIKDKG